MRITKSLMIAALFSFVTFTASATTEPTTATSSRAEIKKLIEKSDVVIGLKEDVTLHVTFLVNAKNEIIIMSTDNKTFDESIKSVLNYKKLKSSDMKVNTTYTLPITLKR